MSTERTLRWSILAVCLMVFVVAGSDCPVDIPFPGDGGDGGDGTDGGDGGTGPTVVNTVFANNTGGGTGIALDADGDLYMVNQNGLYGPITDGTDVSTLTPIGATNLADDTLFDIPQDDFVLAITGDGEFWIGSPCCGTLAVVPAAGGDAAPFLGLINNTPLIQPETFAIVPAAFDGPQMDPGNLLVGADTTFSRIDAVDVTDDSDLAVNNPDGDTNRHAHHLTFGLDGVFYGSRGVADLLNLGIQTIATDGTPTGLAGTLGVAAHSFVAQTDGDLVIRGTYSETASQTTTGMLLYDATAQTVSVGLDMATSDITESDEMIIAADGTIYMSLSERNEIVVVTVTDG